MTKNCSFTEMAGETPTQVRIVAIADDPYKGLKGHDYIAARKLNPPVQRVQTSAQGQPQTPARGRA